MQIQTVLHHYRFDTSKPEQRAEYEKLRVETLEKIGFPVWPMHADFYGYNERKPVEDFMIEVRKLAVAGCVNLETECLFNNQWNGETLRLFNWGECVYNNKHIREGYWIDQTDEMREILRNTHKCGYCGKQEPAAKGYVFCPHCIDSKYLTLDHLHLTRMAPVCDDDKPRAKLTDAERAHLVPLFNAAQIHGATERGKARIAKARAAVDIECDDAIRNAKEKRAAAIWIMDNAPGVYENWIFYTHTARHSFGWRKALNAGEVSALLDVICEFPFAYTIECDDGRKLEGH